MAKGPASKLFVVPSEIQDLAGTLGALAGGASPPPKTARKKKVGNARSRLGAGPNGELPRQALEPAAEQPVSGYGGVPPLYRLWCCPKNRTISAEASGPLGSVYEPVASARPGVS